MSKEKIIYSLHTHSFLYCENTQISIKYKHEKNDLSWDRMRGDISGGADDH